MILEANQMIVYETGSASRKSEITELKEELRTYLSMPFIKRQSEMAVRN